MQFLYHLAVGQLLSDHQTKAYFLHTGVLLVTSCNDI